MSSTVHFFTRGDAGTASSRYRAYMIAKRLEEEGRFETRCLPPRSADPAAIRSIAGLAREFGELRRVWEQSRRIETNDIIYCQRPVNKRLRALYLLLRFRDNPVVFDLDDAVFLQRPNLTRWFIERADAVIAGNTFLQRYAEWYSDRVYLVPTAVPYETYQAVAPDPSGIDGAFRIGWVGNADAHRENLDLLAEIVRRYGERSSDVEAVIVGTKGDEKIEQQFRSIDNVSAELVDWIPGDEYAETVPRFISSFSVGVMPLIDSFWNRGKSAFKLLEYMACGVPVVASPVGENRHILEQGTNGFLADSVPEWLDAFDALREWDTWEKVGTAGRETVVARYTQRSVTEEVGRLLSDLDTSSAGRQ